jgi:hypothetical protein
MQHLALCGTVGLFSPTYTFFLFLVFLEAPAHLGLLSFAPPALGECSHSEVARCSVAVCRAAVCKVPDVQCPHPWPCYEYPRLEDAAGNFAVGQHVVVVIAPFGGGTRGRCAFQSEVV